MPSASLCRSFSPFAQAASAIQGECSNTPPKRAMKSAASSPFKEAEDICTLSAGVIRITLNPLSCADLFETFESLSMPSLLDGCTGLVKHSLIETPGRDNKAQE